MEDLSQTIEMIKASYADTSKSALTPDIAKDFNLNLGLVPFNLESGAKLLFPVLSPLRNQIPRRKGRGTAFRFKAITKINNAGVTLFANEGFQGQKVLTTEVDVTMPYVSMGLYDFVTVEAQIQGEGQVDARALAAANLLRAFMIAEESAILYGQGAAITTASAGGTSVSIGGSVGTVAALTSANVLINTSGGSIPGGATTAGQYVFYQTDVTGMGESLGTAYTAPSGGASSASANQFVWTPVLKGGTSGTQGVISYNLYFRLVGDTTYNKVSSNGAPLTINTCINGGAGAGGGVTLPAADTSAQLGATAANGAVGPAFNGLIAQITASGSGAYYSNVAASFALSMLDTALKSMWDTARADPDQLYANSTEILSLTTATIPLGSASPYFLLMKDQDNVSAGYRISRYVNRVTGSEVKVDVHPVLAQGNMLLLSTKMPAWYPGSDIPSVWVMDMPLDYTQLDYYPTQPQWPFEIRTIGSLALYLPAIQGMIAGIK